MTPQLRKLGRDGPAVPALGLGLMGLGWSIYGTLPADDERFEILDRALALGATFWDTANLYGDCEEILGKWFQRTGKRNEIFLATKFGFIENRPPFRVDSSAENCKKSCEQSLKVLGVDSIDLYYVHAVNPQTPIEETMLAMAELKENGKIKNIGLSNVDSSILRRAVKIAPVAAVQVEYAAFTRDIEGPSGSDLLATCRELGVAVVAYSPLGRGLLTSTFARGQALGDGLDMREGFFPRFQGENRDKNIQIVARFSEIAAKKGCTMAQLAIAWLLKQGEDIIPIPGTKRIKYLEENWGALNVHISDEEEVEIRRFVESAGVAGSHQVARV